MSLIKIKTAIVLCLCFFFSNSQAQEYNKHEVSAYAMGVFSYLKYDVENGNNTSENGIGAGLNYMYRFTEQLGVGIGVGVQSYQGRASYSLLKDNYAATDIEGEDFIFGYTAQDYREKQYTNFIKTPLTLQYETTGLTGFYAVGGIALGFPINAKYQTEINTLTTTGYYPQYDVTLEGPQFMGFGEQNNVRENKKDLDLKNSYSLLLELGVKQQLGENDRIYIGAFFEYGLNELENEETANRLVEYNTDRPAEFEYHSVFTSHNATTGTAYVKGLRTIAYGVKLRYAFSWK